MGISLSFVRSPLGSGAPRPQALTAISRICHSHEAWRLDLGVLGPVHRLQTERKPVHDKRPANPSMTGASAAAVWTWCPLAHAARGAADDRRGRRTHRFGGGA